MQGTLVRPSNFIVPESIAAIKSGRSGNQKMIGLEPKIRNAINNARRQKILASGSLLGQNLNDQTFDVNNEPDARTPVSSKPKLPHLRTFQGWKEIKERSLIEIRPDLHRGSQNG
jgi:hypothetical protein